MFYKAFLVTRNIGDHRSLVNVCVNTDDQCRPALEKTAKQAELLIKNRIHHVDFHPGNVLVDNQGSVFIIDFDKAKISPLPPDKLCRAYFKRWSRAIEKYDLPGIMIDVLSERLQHLMA